MTENLTITLDAFTRSIAVNRQAEHCVLLGAGASLSSGMPSAEKCVIEWKSQIFSTANPGLEKQVGNPFLPSVQRKIQEWLDRQGVFPTAGSEEEYGRYFEYCYPVEEDRRIYFQNIVKRAEPSFGYRLLIRLAESGIINAVWTTNFDGLTARAAVDSSLIAVEVGLDTPERAVRQPRKDELLCVALHGDYRYDSLKNTSSELRHQDATLRHALLEQCRDRTMIVLGYSGRDESVMEALKDAVTTKGPGRLFWCGFQNPEPSDPIADMIRAARRAGRQAFYVNSNGFDDTMRRLALQCLDGENAERAKLLLLESESSLKNCNSPFSLPTREPSALIKTNLFPIDCPSEVYEFEVPSLRMDGAWARLREIVGGARIAAGLLRRNVIAIGVLNEIKSTFGDLISGEIRRVPIAEHELGMPNGIITSILRQSFVRAIAEKIDLETDGDALLWENTAYETREVYRWRCAVYRAVLVSLKRAQGRQFLTLMPTVFGKTERGDDLPEFVEKELKRKILSTQYNQEFNSVLEHWRCRLFPKDIGPIEYPTNTASSLAFQVRRSPAFGSIRRLSSPHSIKIPDKFFGLLQFQGITLDEPKVIFTSRDGRNLVGDGHPIRGLIKNRPYDYALTSRGLDTEVRFGVVCPKPEAMKLRKFLAKLEQRVRANSKQGYLLDYPGFAEAFGLPFVAPEQIDPVWSDCPEPVGRNAREKAISLVKHVRSAIGKITATSSTRLVLVFVPDRWSEFADFNEEGDEISLHDLTKAYCVQRGIASQFLRERTLAKRFDCEVMWWISLSMYAKSMRTPWILNGLAETTAFVGLGFGVQKGKSSDKQIVLGCSHIYSSDGLGLNYRVSKVDNPVFFQRNPHLSEDDAVSVGEGIRQLFFESRGRLPERVVIHKRTPFLNSEREGLLRGLHGVRVVDLLEINAEASVRCTASTVTSDGFAADGAPLDRGTAMLVDRNTFLLWVNGNAHPTSAKENYYMGRFRIPAPISVKKHWGPTNIEDLASEILALSKMNWNTFDLYTRLPATINSSNEIARIGKLLHRFERESFDYRLFI